MDFQISEDELNRLTNITGHLGLMLDLACHITGRDEAPISTENLRCFLATSYDGLSEVLKTVTARGDHDAKKKRRENPTATTGPRAPARKRDQLTAGAN